MNAQRNECYTMIEKAVKAPSGHNTQPWKFRIAENSIDIIPDFNKTLPVVDGDNRELFISLGCAAENVCITATTLGYETAMTIKEEGIITIHLLKNVSIRPDPLFHLIEKRQTNRGVYEYRQIEKDLLDDCFAVMSNEGKVTCYNWKNGTEAFEIIKRLIMEGNKIQMEDKAFVQELKSWMRMNKKEAIKAKDGLSYDVFGAPNLPAFVARPAIGSHLNSNKQNKGDKKKIESASHFILFTTFDNQIPDWINLGRQLQRFLLKSTEYGLAHAYMNQPCEIPGLNEKLREQLSIPTQYPQIILRVGYAKPAPYSRRKNIEEVIME